MKSIYKNFLLKPLGHRSSVSWLAMASTSLVSLCLATSAVGETINFVPIVNDPTRPSEKQLETPEFRERKPKDSFVLPPAPKPLSAPKEGRLVLKKVEFTGNSVVSSEELQKISQPFLNRPLTARDLEELRGRITSVYVDTGYINSGAIISSQSVASEALQIKIVEGNLTEVRLEGMGWLREGYIRDRLTNAAGSPLNLKNLQEKYQVLLSDPLIKQLNGSLLPGTRPGESILTVKVVRARPYQLYAAADDYTTPTVGGYTGRVGGWVDNITGLGERIDGDFIVTGGALGFNTGIDMPLNVYDTHATFRYSNTSTSLTEKPVDLLKIKTDIIGYEGGFSQPLYRGLGIELKAGINLSVRESYSTILDQPYTFTEGLPFGVGKTKVAALRNWQQYVQQGTNNTFVFRSTFSHGLNAMGATIQKGSLPSGDFFSWLGQTQYSHRVMDNGAQFVLRGAVQQASSSLLPLERFAVGGAHSVRGFRENYYVRDNGFSSGLEFHYPLFGGEPTAKHSLFLIPFMDYGGAWNNLTVADLNPKKNYLHSVGIGFNWHYSHVNTEFFWAHDIANIKTLSGERSIQDDGIHFKVGLVAF